LLHDLELLDDEDVGEAGAGQGLVRRRCPGTNSAEPPAAS
ncbi:MAG: hypothetical protein K0R41_4466, partial [Geminicoccaceae bacterium]|nr:hypothetical protein [Geminicoccaceae bacterium]